MFLANNDGGGRFQVRSYTRKVCFILGSLLPSQNETNLLAAFMSGVNLILGEIDWQERGKAFPSPEVFKSAVRACPRISLVRQWTSPMHPPLARQYTPYVVFSGF